jgi:hypothetical protein
METERKKLFCLWLFVTPKDAESFYHNGEKLVFKTAACGDYFYVLHSYADPQIHCVRGCRD